MLYPPSVVPISISDIRKIGKLYLNNSCAELSHMFTQKAKMKLGVQNIVTYQSGMLAMIMLLKYLSTKSDAKEIIIPAYTCPTVLLSIKYANLIPIFVDINEKDFCISQKDAINKVSPSTLAIIIPHMFGHVVDIDELLEYRSKSKCKYFIIEDFCQSIITSIECSTSIRLFGDYGIFSFGRAKCISTVCGGAIVTYNKDNETAITDLQKKSVQVKSIVKDFILFTKLLIYTIALHPWLYKLTDTILSSSRKNDRFNLSSYSRLDYTSDNPLYKIQYSIGVVMVDKLKDMAKRRIANGIYYYREFSCKDILTQPIKNHFYLKFPIVIIDRNLRQEFVAKIYRNRIKYSTGDYPVISTIVGYNASTVDPAFPIASKVASNIILLPTHPCILPSAIFK